MQKTSTLENSHHWLILGRSVEKPFFALSMLKRHLFDLIVIEVCVLALRNIYYILREEDHHPKVTGECCI